MKTRIKKAIQALKPRPSYRYLTDRQCYLTDRRSWSDSYEREISKYFWSRF